MSEWLVSVSSPVVVLAQPGMVVAATVLVVSEEPRWTTDLVALTVVGVLRQDGGIERFPVPIPVQVTRQTLAGWAPVEVSRVTLANPGTIPFPSRPS